LHIHCKIAGDIILNCVFYHSSGIDAALALDSPVQPQHIGNKLNSSGEPAAEIPPLVFPSFPNEDKVPIREGVELPPSVFPSFPNEDKVPIEGEELPPLVFPEVPVSTSHKLRGNESTENVTSPGNETKSTKKLASEVQDLLNSDMYNITVFEDGTDEPARDTVTVTGPNVINSGKTHEEDVTASNMENKENVTKNPGTSVPSTSDTVESTFEFLNITNFINYLKNISNTEEVTLNAENGTIPIETIEPHNDVPVTKAHIAGKDDESNHSVSENNVQGKEEEKSDITTMMNETTAKSESVSSITQQPSTIKFTSVLPVQQSEITTSLPTLKVESTTSVDISHNLIDHTAEDTPFAMATSQKDGDHSHESSGKSPFLQPSESAAILAAAFVGVALIGYVGLLVWRRILE
jgi:hypothetical protein